MPVRASSRPIALSVRFHCGRTSAAGILPMEWTVRPGERCSNAQ